MAMTIQQLQDFSNTYPELRWLTEQIIDYLQANPSSPGGGGVQSVTGDLVDNTDPENPVINGAGSFLVATVEFNDDDIKKFTNIDFGNKEIIAAPGANKMIVPISAFGILDTISGAYTPTNQAIWSLYVGDLDFTVNGTDVNTAITSTFRRYIPFFFHSLPFTDPIRTVAQININNAINQPLTIRDSNFGSDPDYSDGNAANTLKVTVYYVVVDL